MSDHDVERQASGRGARDHWDDLAGWWQDTFTEGADAEYECQIIPLAMGELAGAAQVLDLGCGEGQIARRLAAQDSVVVGLDFSAAQLDRARARRGGPGYVQGSCGALPSRGSAFDAVLVSLVLEHTDALDGTIGEIARVLRPGGRVVLVLNHPLLQSPGSGWVDDHLVEPPETYWQVGPYLSEVEFEEQVDAEHTVCFVHRPLSRYINAFADAGLYVTRMVEPGPIVTPRDHSVAAATEIPRVLLLRAEKLMP